MAFNTIQFQHGMSLPEFIERFVSEEQCAQTVKVARWPNGFRCARCDAPEHCVGHGARELFQCQACRYQTSLTVGSLFEYTKLPLRTWFLAIYLLSQAKIGLSSLTLKRHLGVSYPTAWALQHKISHAMPWRCAKGNNGSLAPCNSTTPIWTASTPAASPGAAPRTRRRS